MHPAFATPRDSLGTECPDETVPGTSSDFCRTASRPPVGASLQPLSDAELDRHIADLTTLWQQAYARFQEHGNPHDRDEALRWLHERDQATLDRVRRLEDAGCCYFSSDAAQALGRAGRGA